ncbi:MAG TPA: VOC family protein [Thermoanaerobaculia bacterium]
MLTNRSMPDCTVIPELAYPDVAAAVEWLCKAFGFTLRIRIGGHRAQLNVGDGAIVVREGTTGGDRVMVRVDDAGRHCATAETNGARIILRPTTHPFGERQYTAEDFAGREWVFSESVADVAPEEWGGTRS